MKNLICSNCKIDVNKTGLKWSNRDNVWYCRKCTNISDLNHAADLLRHKEYEEKPDLKFWQTRINK